MAKLLIVESPGKLKTLRQILGPGWKIEASVGHTTELSYDGPKRLGFEFKNGRVITHYSPRGDRGKQVLAKLRQAAAGVDEVFLATDPDREGEAIAWHLIQQLKLKKFCRVTYTQITEAAVKKAISNPTHLNQSLVESQRARQCLDKLVGFEVSPLLWNSTGGRSAGRVQSATLHLLCERERERLAFKPEAYWVLKAFYDSEGGTVLEAVYEPEQPSKEEAAAAATTEGDAPETVRVRTKEEAERIAEIAKTNPHIVQSAEEKVEFRKAPPPLITSSLQQVAGAKFRFSPKHTMQIAQELYEGIRGKGLITYMRTDAVALSPEFVAETRQWIDENAADLLPSQAPTYKMKDEAQGAHEAIRPTSVTLTPSQAASMLSPDQLKLYTLIWERAVACQCKPAKLSRSKIDIRAAETRWIARGMMVLEEGYLRFWKNLEGEKELPLVKQGQELILKDLKSTDHMTKPPPRYSEPRLVQLMERKGIGRPSTYASTIATLKDREYVKLEASMLAPTELGMATDEALMKALPDLIDSKFTADMEADLDRIAEGKLAWEKYLIEWSTNYLEPAVVKARDLLVGVARVAGAPRAGGKRGGAASALPAGEVAAKLEKAMANARKNSMVPVCPKSHGELILRLSKKGTYYWRCSVPACEEMAWYQELSIQKCPACEARMEKIPSKKVSGGYFLKCGKKTAHPGAEEILMFKNKKTKEWEQAKPRSSGSGTRSKPPLNPIPQSRTPLN